MKPVDRQGFVIGRRGMMTQMAPSLLAASHRNRSHGGPRCRACYRSQQWALMLNQACLDVGGTVVIAACVGDDVDESLSLLLTTASTPQGRRCTRRDPRRRLRCGRTERARLLVARRVLRWAGRNSAGQRAALPADCVSLRP
eukprot:scaffold548345_cov20-Prasinocladus_malaysianus.AAC.1